MPWPKRDMLGYLLRALLRAAFVRLLVLWDSSTRANDLMVIRMPELRCGGCGWPLAEERVGLGARFCYACAEMLKTAEPHCHYCNSPLAPINALARVKECFVCTVLISTLNWSLYWQGVERQAVASLRRLRDEGAEV